MTAASPDQRAIYDWWAWSGNSQAEMNLYRLRNTAIPHWNCRGTFKPAAHFCISLLKSHSDGKNCQEQHMGRVQLLRESEKEQAWMGFVCLRTLVSVCVCVFVARWKIVKRTDAPPKSEGGSSSEVKRPEFTPSRSYKFIKVKFVRDCPALCWPEF